MGKVQDPIPAKPFSDWLNHRYEQLAHRERVVQRYDTTKAELGAKGALCRELGWPEGDTGLRRLHRYRTMIGETYIGRTDQNYKRRGEKGIRGKRKILPIEVFPRRVVEDALNFAGIPFEDLYPEIAATEEVWLEPEKWCPGCREARTPIDGQCPFCDWRLGPKTGQTLRGSRLVS